MQKQHMIDALEQATQFLYGHGTDWLIGVSDVTHMQGIALQADSRWFDAHAPDDCGASWHPKPQYSIWVRWHVSDVLVIHALFYRSEPCRWRGQLIEDVMQELEQLKEPTNETLQN